jgi:hypothetical protein
MVMLGAVGSCFARRRSFSANYGKTFRMSTLARELLGGGRMVLQVYLIRMDYKILRFLSGTKRSECSRRIPDPSRPF